MWVKSLEAGEGRLNASGGLRVCASEKAARPRPFQGSPRMTPVSTESTARARCLAHLYPQAAAYRGPADLTEALAWRSTLSAVKLTGDGGRELGTGSSEPPWQRLPPALKATAAAARRGCSSEHD